MSFSKYKRLYLLSVGPFIPLLVGYFAYSYLTIRGYGDESTTNVQLSRTHFDISPLCSKELSRIYSTLPSNVVNIARDAGTERAFTKDNYYHNKEDGVYISIVSGLPLFDSTNKYDSGSGWPSFWLPFDTSHITLYPDNSHSMKRIEVIDSKSQSHIGHVFNDGPLPTHMRYCINGATLKFIPRNEFNQQYGTEYLNLRQQYMADFVQEAINAAGNSPNPPEHDEI